MGYSRESMPWDECWGRRKETPAKKMKQSDPVRKEEKLETLVCLRQMKSASNMVVSLWYKMLVCTNTNIWDYCLVCNNIFT